MTTQSRQGVSTVSVRMRLNTDPNAALTEVTAKVQQIRAQLPQEAEDPVHHEGHGPELLPSCTSPSAATEMNSTEQVSDS